MVREVDLLVLWDGSVSCAWLVNGDFGGSVVVEVGEIAWRDR